MPARWNKGEIIAIETLSPTTKQFTIKVEGTEILNYKAGQFIVLDLPIGEKRLNRWRSYSIANAPDQSNIIQLSIVYLEGGRASQYFFEEVKIGTEVKFKKPDGNFCLPDEIVTDLVFICTGTGVAPFRSMLQTIQQGKIKHKNIHLVFGTRKKEGILYRNEFEKLQEDNPNFKYYVALSRVSEIQQEDFNFPITKGYLHQIYQSFQLDAMDKPHFYICGWTQMIDDAVANLFVKMQVPKQQIHYELYG